MAETSPRPGSATPTPSTVPQKRSLGLEDEQHTPAIPSPLNPDSTGARSRRPPPREQREKKESLKKREAKGVDGARSATPDSQGPGRKGRKSTQSSSVLSPIRYKLPPPKTTDFEPPKAPIFTPILAKAQRQFYESSEHVYNRKGFRYIHCIADPAFPSSQYHRQSETEPHGPRFNFEDASPHVLFDVPGRSITTEKGFRMARANVGVREGRWYWECKILSGVKPPHHSPSNQEDSNGGHVRVGWARREASLDTPVGFDAYSYGLRDVAGQKVHMSRPKDFMPANTSFCEGDVIGLELTLPTLSLHRKIVEGTYNKAVDVSDDLLEPGHNPTECADIIRDRVPIRYKAHLYFEQFEYHATKELEELMNPSPVLSATATASTNNSNPSAQATSQPPNPNHTHPSLRTLPFSSVKIYKNGQAVGTPFTNLLAFLPPASKPLNQVGAREGLDDGMLGYFPAISVFRGGAAEANFGPDFWFPPPGLASRTRNDDEDVDMRDPAVPKNTTQSSKSPLRPLSERFAEQIAEDIVFDLVDEIDFWVQDGRPEAGHKAKALLDDAEVESVSKLGQAGMMGVGLVGMVEGGLGGGIKEVVQEVE